MLKIDNLVVSYGPINALKGISLNVKQGEIVTLIGSNGAGKSTTLSAITGLVRAQSGTIRFMDEDITHAPPHKIISRGISISPEGREVFPALTVQENLRLGGYTRKDNHEPDGRHAVRRRAADAGHWPGADERAEAVAAG